MRVLWFVASLEQRGGGERFVLEAVEALRALNHEAIVVCDRLAEAASFDGRYDLSQVICLNRSIANESTYEQRAFTKFMGFFSLLAIAFRLRPNVIICQSEFDAIKVKYVSRIVGCRYKVFVFGQMFQFKTDISKYSTVFRKHLKTIAASRPGYHDTVVLPPPQLPPLRFLANEVISRLKYKALHHADEAFALSNQVKWEVSLLYGRDARVVRAAIADEQIDEAALRSPRPATSPLRFLSVCRLVEKKRVGLIIRGFEAASIDGVLRIVGIGPEVDALHSLAQSCSKRDNIIFLGAVDEKQLTAEFAAADCFVSMDIGDFDISVVEAMAKGLRVIVPEDFDMSEFGDDFDGVTVVTPTEDAVADAMRAVPTMPAPSIRNLASLRKVTWNWLATECVR